MAKAPKPGSRATPSEAPNSFLRLRLRDEYREVNLQVSLQEAFVIRSAASTSLESLMANFGLDSFAVLWWLARRQNGEAQLPFQVFAREWNADVLPGLTQDDIDLDDVDIAETPGTDSPEDEGLAS